MTAFPIADVLPDDPSGYRDSGYLDGALKTVTEHGGTYIARGGETTVLEGEWEPDRMVIIQFPSMDALMGWYHSDEYQKWAKVRRQYVPSSKMIALEGVS